MRLTLHLNFDGYADNEQLLVGHTLTLKKTTKWSEND